MPSAVVCRCAVYVYKLQVLISHKHLWRNNKQNNILTLLFLLYDFPFLFYITFADISPKKQQTDKWNTNFHVCSSLAKSFSTYFFSHSTTVHTLFPSSCYAFTQNNNSNENKRIKKGTSYQNHFNIYVYVILHSFYIFKRKLSLL